MTSTVETMPEASGVYRIVCEVSGHSYIGSSADVRRRARAWRGSLTRGRSTNKNLIQSVTLHGIGAHRVELLELCDATMCRLREQAHIDAMKPEMNCQSAIRQIQNEKHYFVRIRPETRRVLNEVCASTGWTLMEAMDRAADALVEKERQQPIRRDRRRAS